jgi:hypothetical protein
MSRYLHVKYLWVSYILIILFPILSNTIFFKLWPSAIACILNFTRYETNSHIYFAHSRNRYVNIYSPEDRHVRYDDNGKFLSISGASVTN